MTLLGENLFGAPPSQEELAEWADNAGATHPILSDGNWEVTARYLDSNYIALPSMHQMGAGLEILRRDTEITEDQIREALP